MQIKTVLVMAKNYNDDNDDDDDRDNIDDDLLLVQLSFDQHHQARRWRWFGQYHYMVS